MVTATAQPTPDGRAIIATVYLGVETFVGSVREPRRRRVFSLT